MMLERVTGVGSVGQIAPTTNRSGGEGFSNRLESAVQSLNQSQVGADDQLRAVAAGEDVDLHSAMIALEEADIALRAAVSVRDKVVEAYQQIMNMAI